MRPAQGAGEACLHLLCVAGLRAADTSIVPGEGGAWPQPLGEVCLWGKGCAIGCGAPSGTVNSIGAEPTCAPPVPLPPRAHSVPVKNHRTLHKCHFSKEHTAFWKLSLWRPWPLRFSVTRSQGQLKTSGYSKAALVLIGGFHGGRGCVSVHRPAH